MLAFAQASFLFALSAPKHHHGDPIIAVRRGYVIFVVQPRDSILEWILLWAGG